MPVVPPPSPWEFPDLRSANPGGDFVALGADLAPATLLAAYSSGLFPMPDSSGSVGWWSPDPRGVLPLDNLRVTRSLAKAAKHFEIRVDTAFDEVVAGCADPSRDGAWIDDEITTAYRTLFDLGWAHSVEAWRDGRLAGGLYGVAIGGLFAGESMFHVERDASKVALVGLVELLNDEHASDRVLDVQWETEHLATLGIVEVTRADYLRRLTHALTIPLPQVWR